MMGLSMTADMMPEDAWVTEEGDQTPDCKWPLGISIDAWWVSDLNPDNKEAEYSGTHRGVSWAEAQAEASFTGKWPSPHPV